MDRNNSLRVREILAKCTVHPFGIGKGDEPAASIIVTDVKNATIIKALPFIPVEEFENPAGH